MNRLPLALLCLGLFACEETGRTPLPPGVIDPIDVDIADVPDIPIEEHCAESQEVVVGDWTVSLDIAGVLRLTRDGVTLESESFCNTDQQPAVRVMRGSPKVMEAFGNFRIDLRSDGDTEWFDPVSGAYLEATEDGAQLNINIGGDPVSIVFSEDRAQGVRVQLVAPAYDGGELAFKCENSAFFGLGSQVTGMDLRGRTYPLWTQEQGNGKPASGAPFPVANIPEAAYAPMGIWHSNLGWSALVTHDAFSELSLCHDSESMVLRSYPEQPGLVLVTGTPRERMAKVTEFTGRASDVPDWVFGFWVSAVGGPWRVDEVAQTLRSRGIPASGIWTEDWIGGDSTAFGYRLSYAWEWDPLMYPDLPTQVQGLKAQGFAFLSYFNPFVPEPTRMFAEGVEGGFLLKNADDELITFGDPAFRNASMVDLTNPGALAWLRGYQERAIEEIGADGWMVDFAEWLPTFTKMHDGTDGWRYHNRYPLEWQRVNRKVLEEVRESQGMPGNWTYFARSGWASANGGTAGIAPTMWAGDQDTSWKYDDGFPTIFPIGAHLGMSGIAIYGSDIAGYSAIKSAPTTKDLFFRWMSAGAFHPLMRTHHGGAECDNWSFDRDEETLLHTRRYARIHGRFLPYFKELMTSFKETGMPLTRHPYLVFPDNQALWSTEEFQVFLGDDLLIAPVMVQDATSRQVVLPETGWWPLFGTQPMTETEAMVDATLSEIPVFVRPGLALVMMPEVDSFYGASTEGVTDLSDVAERIVALYPDANQDVTFARGDVQITAQNMDAWTPASLVVCEFAAAEEPCRDGDLVVVPTSLETVTVGGATLNVSTTDMSITTLRVGVARAAWGELAEATSFEANPDAPTWCSRHPD